MMTWSEVVNVIFGVMIVTAILAKFYMILDFIIIRLFYKVTLSKFNKIW